MTVQRVEDSVTVTPTVKVSRYVACPACGRGEFGVSHLPPGTDTAWYCHEPDCGRRFNVLVLNNLNVRLTLRDEWCLPSLVELRSDSPVTLLVKGSVFVNRRTGKGDESLEEKFESDRYYYEEHTCPTNYLSNVLQVRDDSGDTDPHGIFKYVKTEAWRNVEDDDNPHVVDIRSEPVTDVMPEMSLTRPGH